MNTVLNFFGFVALITAFIVFRQFMVNRRRRTMARFQARVDSAATGLLICPNCHNQVRAGSFCGVCGAALPPPLPMAATARGRFLMYLLFAIMGLIGLLAFFAANSRPERRTTPQFGTPPSKW